MCMHRETNICTASVCIYFLLPNIKNVCTNLNWKLFWFISSKIPCTGKKNSILKLKMETFLGLITFVPENYHPDRLTHIRFTWKHNLNLNITCYELIVGTGDNAYHRHC